MKVQLFQGIIKTEGNIKEYLIKYSFILPLFTSTIFFFFNNKRLLLVISFLSSIFNVYYILIIYILYNNNSLEFQYRDVFFIKDYVRISLGLDGLNLSLIILTIFVIPIIIYISSKFLLEDKNLKEILYYIFISEFILILLLSSLDILIFYFLFELILIPIFLLVIYFGSLNKRLEASFRFLLYSITGSLLMLIGIILLYIIYGSTNNELLSIKFKYLLNSINNIENLFLWISFFIALSIKVPVFPFHSWLPQMHCEAPSTGSIILAAILLKLGCFGFYRYIIYIFSDITLFVLPIIITLSIISIVYSSFTIIVQIDIKKIIAISSIIHMNYLMLGIYNLNLESLIGSAYMMISHALISSAFFILIGMIYERYHTRIIYYIRGLFSTMPIFSVVFFFVNLSNISFPVTSSFISEYLLFVGIIENNIYVIYLISFFLIFSAIYSMWLTNRLLFGKVSHYIKLYKDLSKNEFLILFVILILIYFLGIKTNNLLNIFSSSIYKLISSN